MLFRKSLWALLLLLALIVVLVLLAGWLQRQALLQPLNITEEYLLEIQPGATPRGTLQRLAEQQILRQSFWVRLYWRMHLHSTLLHAGEYLLLPGMTALQLLELWQRAEVIQYSVTLVEGWTFQKVRTLLAEQGKLVQVLPTLSDAGVMQAVGAPNQSPEGWFFPDTYHYTKGMQDLDLLKLAAQRQQSILAQEWQNRVPDLPYTTPYQALIMASLIERETGVAGERPEIAGVFVRRLERNMLLQTDPTVIYGLGARYRGDLTRAHLRDPNPYNTYVHPGLPPTPIALAGRAAIRAALNPAIGDSLYFVARGDGSHVFSNTLAEHNQAVRAYQMKRRADYRSSPGPTTRQESE